MIACLKKYDRQGTHQFRTCHEAVGFSGIPEVNITLFPDFIRTVYRPVEGEQPVEGHGPLILVFDSKVKAAKGCFELNVAGAVRRRG